MRERAGHIPGLPAEALGWETLPFEARGQRLDVAVPVLDDAQFAALARRLREARRDYLAALPVETVIGIVDAAVARLLDRNDPRRRKAEALLRSSPATMARRFASA